MIAIVDYGIGNLGSIFNILRKIGADPVVVSDPDELVHASKIILPGVGPFDVGMERLEASGMIPALNESALGKKTAVLGVCLGMQLFTRSSEEGARKGLGWIDASTVKFSFSDEKSNFKIPNMGWNILDIKKPSPLFENIADEQKFYFLHSYHVVCDHPEDVLSYTPYGYPFVSALERENIYGVQFHPEKSHKFGMSLFKHFVERC